MQQIGCLGKYTPEKSPGVLQFFVVGSAFLRHWTEVFQLLRIQLLWVIWKVSGDFSEKLNLKDFPNEF